MDMEVDQVEEYSNNPNISMILYGATYATLSVADKFYNVPCTKHIGENEGVITVGEVEKRQICVTCVVEKYQKLLISGIIPHIKALCSRSKDEEEHYNRLMKEQTELKNRVTELCNKFDQFFKEQEWENPEEIRQSLRENYFECMHTMAYVSRAMFAFSPDFQEKVRNTCQELHNMMSSYEQHLDPAFVGVNNEIKNEFLNIIQRM